MSTQNTQLNPKGVQARAENDGVLLGYQIKYKENPVTLKSLNPEGMIEMSSKNDIKLGLFIAAAGVVILFGKLGVFGFLGRNLWPLVLLLPGLYLHVLFFTRRVSATVLIPAGILTVYGLLFGICNTWGWGLMKYLWPVLLIGLAVGLYEYSVYSSSRISGLTGTAVSLALLSLVLLIFSLLGTGALYLLGAILIAVGIWLIAGIGKSGNGRKNSRGW